MRCVSAFSRKRSESRRKLSVDASAIVEMSSRRETSAATRSRRLSFVVASSTTSGVAQLPFRGVERAKKERVNRKQLQPSARKSPASDRDEQQVLEGRG